MPRKKMLLEVWFTRDESRHGAADEVVEELGLQSTMRAPGTAEEDSQRRHQWLNRILSRFLLLEYTLRDPWGRRGAAKEKVSGGGRGVK